MRQEREFSIKYDTKKSGFIFDFNSLSVNFELRFSLRKALDCSPTNRERELGLDRRETG